MWSQYLDIGAWIPVRVIDDNTICASQVDSKSAHTSGEQEDKYAGILDGKRRVIKRSECMPSAAVVTIVMCTCITFFRNQPLPPIAHSLWLFKPCSVNERTNLIESFDHGLARSYWCSPIHPEVGVPLRNDKSFQNVQHLLEAEHN